MIRLRWKRNPSWVRPQWTTAEKHAVADTATVEANPVTKTAAVEKDAFKVHTHDNGIMCLYANTNSANVNFHPEGIKAGMQSKAIAVQGVGSTLVVCFPCSGLSRVQRCY